MATRTEIRSKRWDLRVAPSEDDLVKEAAELAEEGVSAFVREAALQEAQRVLADRRTFSLPDDEWRQFNELLDRPAEVSQGLRDLFSKPSVFGN